MSSFAFCSLLGLLPPLLNWSNQSCGVLFGFTEGMSFFGCGLLAFKSVASEGTMMLNPWG
jgi:hypothetical protein